MFSPQTVFILGAGASADVNLPTGDELRSYLMSILEREGRNARYQNEQFNQAIYKLCVQRSAENWPTRFEEYAAATRRIRYALPMAVSIDNLLHTHCNDQLMVQVGKLAIAVAILEKEAGSYLCPKAPGMRGDVELAVTNTPNMAKSWYLPLMRLLVTGRTVQELAQIFENVAFVVFNYDRCLEHFLVNAVINYFHAEPSIAAETVNKLTIIHPYGQVGRLRWQQDATSRVISSYGNSNDQLVEIADQLLTFTESANEGVVQASRELVAGAKTLVFMGFGFLPQNMDLLTVSKRSSVERVFVTTKGIGADDVEIVISEIEEMVFGGTTNELDGRALHFHPFVERGTCRELMDHHWLRLTRR